MRVLSTNGIGFKRAFSTEERKSADIAIKKALELLDCDKVIAIIPEASFPSDPKTDIGIGQLNSKYNDKFYDFLKTYTGATSIKILPSGEYSKTQRKFYCNYKSSCLTLGTHNINLEELKEKGYTISDETLNKIYTNAKKDGKPNYAHYENVVGTDTNFNKALKEAFDGLNNSQSSQMASEKIQFENFKNANKDIIEKRALFECLEQEYGTENFHEWKDIDKNLFNPDLVSKESKNKRILELKNKYKENIDFTFFKQYLAEENLAKARKRMHQKGLTLTGDCQIGFSADEIWAYPKAFENAFVCSKDWGLYSLNFADIDKEGSESNKLLKLKFKQAAKRYDNIRIDVGWAYVNPVLYTGNDNAKLLEGRYVYDATVDGYRVKEPLGDKAVQIIENAVKEIKGADYRKENIFYEIEAWTKDFSPYDWNNNKIIDPLENRTIIQSTSYINENYATIDMLENRMRIPRKNYIIMAGNHDHLNLASLAEKKDPYNLIADGIDITLSRQYEPIASALKIDEGKLKNSPEEFIKAKFAYNFLGKNLKMFFMDIFGRSEQFDAQQKNTTNNYRNRIPSNYEKEFHRAVQEKHGLNVMDAISKAMKAKNLDKTNKSLYREIKKYSKILSKKGALTEDEANKIKRLKKRNICISLILAGIILVLGTGLYKFEDKFKSKNNK